MVAPHPGLDDDSAEPAMASSLRRLRRGVPPWVRRRLDEEKRIEVERSKVGLPPRPTREERRRTAAHLAKLAENLRREAAERSNSTDIPF